VLPIANTPTTPALHFGGSTGIYSPSADLIAVSFAGSKKLDFYSNGFLISTRVQLQAGGAPNLENATASPIQATVNPHRSDANTGLGWATTSHMVAVSNSLPAAGWVRLSGVVGTAVTIIADGVGDVTLVLSGTFTVSDGAGNVAGGVITATAPSGTFNLYDDGGTNTLKLQIAANGAVTVQRTAGSRTYSVTLNLTWQ
jgi:hypothetical protein